MVGMAIGILLIVAIGFGAFEISGVVGNRRGLSPFDRYDLYFRLNLGGLLVAILAVVLFGFAFVWR